MTPTHTELNLISQEGMHFPYSAKHY